MATRFWWPLCLEIKEKSWETYLIRKRIWVSKKIELQKNQIRPGDPGGTQRGGQVQRPGGGLQERSNLKLLIPSRNFLI